MEENNIIDRLKDLWSDFIYWDHGRPILVVLFIILFITLLVLYTKIVLVILMSIVMLLFVSYMLYSFYMSIYEFFND